MSHAEIVSLNGTTIFLTVKETGENKAYTNTVIKIEGNNASSIAKGIARMINESQCISCGKFNGLHGEIFYGQSCGSGEVNGHYEMCPLGKVK
jgi:hypothetical protein